MIPQNPVQTVLSTIDSESQRLGRPIQLIAVSKYVGPEALDPLIAAGITHFGENRIQDAIPKIEQIGQTHPNLVWHLIGHLQTNKVRKAVPYFDWIQSIDSMKVLEKLNEVAAEHDKVLQGLIQLNIGEEEQKHGFSLEEFRAFEDKFFTFSHISIRGLMAILPKCESKDETAGYFERMSDLFESFSKRHDGVDTLSMGMSADYDLAIEKGATMVRVGSTLFRGII